MSKWYGNIMNRLGENGSSAPIEVGTDITMYMWSDRDCFYVTEVIDEKHIKVHDYVVVADRDKESGMGHQNWLYFKNHKEANDYLERYESKRIYLEEENPDQTWAFRYGKWMKEYTITNPDWCDSERERKSMEKNGYFKRYYDLPGKVRFGVRNYYYDWEF